MSNCRCACAIVTDLRKVHDAVTGVVHQHVDAAALQHDFAHRAIHGDVIGDVEFQCLQGKGFALGEILNFARAGGVAALYVAHCCENLIILARQRFGDQPPKPLLAPVIKTTC